MKKYIKLFFLLILCVSCRKNDKIKNKYPNNQVEVVEDKISTFVFPDTIKVGKYIKGELKYNIKNTGIVEKINSRYIYLYVTSEKQEGITANEIQKTNFLIYKDTIGNGFFTFEAKFSKLGNQLLNGAVVDIIFYDDNRIDKDSMMIKEIETQFTKDVYVVE